MPTYPHWHHYDYYFSPFCPVTEQEKSAVGLLVISYINGASSWFRFRGFSFDCLVFCLHNSLTFSYYRICLHLSFYEDDTSACCVFVLTWIPSGLAFHTNSCFNRLSRADLGLGVRQHEVEVWWHGTTRLSPDRSSST
jgi:hypothetical protein